MSPADSDDLTTIIEADGGSFIVLWSPAIAEHDPDYRQLGSFRTRQEAQAFVTKYC